MFNNKQLILCAKVYRIQSYIGSSCWWWQQTVKTATIHCRLHGLWVLLMDDDDNDDNGNQIYIGSVFLNLQVVRSRVQVPSWHGAAVSRRCHSACYWSNVAPSTAVCIVIRSCGASNTSFITWGQTEPSRLLDHEHRTVYLTSSLTALHLSPSKNTSSYLFSLSF